MPVHDSPAVVVLGALLAKVEQLVEAMNLGPLVLAVHAFVLVFEELLLSANHKVGLVLYLIPLLIVYHEVVLEGILFAIAFEQDRVSQTHLVLDGPYFPQVEPTQQKGEDLVGANLGVDVDVAAVEDHFLGRERVGAHSFDVLAIEVSDLEDPLSLEVLPRILSTYCFASG